MTKPPLQTPRELLSKLIKKYAQAIRNEGDLPNTQEIKARILKDRAYKDNTAVRKLCSDQGLGDFILQEIEERHSNALVSSLQLTLWAPDELQFAHGIGRNCGWVPSKNHFIDLYNKATDPVDILESHYYHTGMGQSIISSALWEKQLAEKRAKELGVKLPKNYEELKRIIDKRKQDEQDKDAGEDQPQA